MTNPKAPSPSEKPSAFSAEETLKHGGAKVDDIAPVPQYIHATLTIARGNDVGRVFQVTSQRTIIGRGESADVVLDDQSLSREHAAITYHHSVREFRVEDLGSANGTLLNGSKVTSYGIRHGDKLLVGDTLLVFERTVVES
jgi:pSer/pThr/pTyr-binding forkhead associated (FHA) protein